MTKHPIKENDGMFFIEGLPEDHPLWEAGFATRDKAVEACKRWSSKRKRLVGNTLVLSEDGTRFLLDEMGEEFRVRLYESAVRDAVGKIAQRHADALVRQYWEGAIRHAVEEVLREQHPEALEKPGGVGVPALDISRSIAEVHINRTKEEMDSWSRDVTRKLQEDLNGRLSEAGDAAKKVIEQWLQNLDTKLPDMVEAVLAPTVREIAREARPLSDGSGEPS